MSILYVHCTGIPWFNTVFSLVAGRLKNVKRITASHIFMVSIKFGRLLRKFLVELHDVYGILLHTLLLRLRE